MNSIVKRRNIPADPCRPRAKRHVAALAWLASRGIAQPKPLYPARIDNGVSELTIDYSVAPARKLRLV